MPSGRSVPGHPESRARRGTAATHCPGQSLLLGSAPPPAVNGDTVRHGSLGSHHGIRTPCSPENHITPSERDGASDPSPVTVLTSPSRGTKSIALGKAGDGTTPLPTAAGTRPTRNPTAGPAPHSIVLWRQWFCIPPALRMPELRPRETLWHTQYHLSNRKYSHIPKPHSRTTDQAPSLSTQIQQGYYLNPSPTPRFCLRGFPIKAVPPISHPQGASSSTWLRQQDGGLPAGHKLLGVAHRPAPTGSSSMARDASGAPRAETAPQSSGHPGQQDGLCSAS